MSVVESVKSFVEALGRAFENVGVRISDAFKSAEKRVTSSFHYIANLPEALEKFAHELWSGIVRVVEKVYEIVLEVLKFLWGKIKEFLGWVIHQLMLIADAVFRTIMSAYNWIKNKFSLMSSGFSNYVGRVIEGIVFEARRKIVLLTAVNFGVIGVYRGLEKVLDGDVKNGLLSMFLAPLAGAVAGEVLNSLLPQPTRVYTPFVYRGEIPQEDVEETINPEVPLIVTPSDSVTIIDYPVVHIEGAKVTTIDEIISVRDDARVAVGKGKVYELSEEIRVEDDVKVCVYKGKYVSVIENIRIDDWVAFSEKQWAYVAPVENITVSDACSVQTPVGKVVSIKESITVRDNIIVSAGGGKHLTTTDTITISDECAPKVGTSIRKSVSESISVSDSAVVSIKPINQVSKHVTTTDTIRVSDTCRLSGCSY